MGEISNRCNTDICKGVCCTFLTFTYNKKLDDDFKRFLLLHDIEIKEVWETKAHQRVLKTHLRMPLVCSEFDLITKKCKIYETRPRWCRTHPDREGIFIPKQICSVLTPELLKIKKEG